MGHVVHSNRSYQAYLATMIEPLTDGAIECYMDAENSDVETAVNALVQLGWNAKETQLRNLDPGTKQATVKLDGHPNVEYAVTFIEKYPGAWALTKVTISAVDFTLLDWDFRPSAARLVHNAVYGCDLLPAWNGSEPRDEFDWMHPSLSGRLQTHGINTMAALARMQDDDIREIPGMQRRRLHQLDRGLHEWMTRISTAARDGLVPE